MPVSPQGSHSRVGLAQGALAPHLSASSQMQMLGRTWLSNSSFSFSAIPMTLPPWAVSRQEILYHCPCLTPSALLLVLHPSLLLLPVREEGV